MVLRRVLYRCDATCVKDFPEAVGGVGVWMAHGGRHDAWIETNEDKDEIWP